jgi:plastocyanin
MSTKFSFFAFLVVLALAGGQGCPGSSESNNPLDNSGTSSGCDQTGTGNTTGTGGTDNSGDTGGSTGGGTTTSVFEVLIDDYVFKPKSITIQVNQTIRWRNKDFTPHRIRSGNPEDENVGELFRSESLGINQIFEHTFDTPGTYPYHCEFHYNRPDSRDAEVIVTAPP